MYRVRYVLDTDTLLIHPDQGFKLRSVTAKKAATKRFWCLPLLFLHGEIKSRRNADTTATKHRYGRNETQYGRDKILIDIDFHFFQ
jgi:hypothetical protein